MYIHYKIHSSYQKEIKKYVSFAYGSFNEYDMETLASKIQRIEFLIKTIPQIEDYLKSEKYFDYVKELEEYVLKVDFLNINPQGVEFFFEHLMEIAGESNYHNIERNEMLFVSLVDLALSFMCQHEVICYQLMDSGFINFAKFLLDKCMKTRKDNEVYEAIAKAVVKSPRIQERVLNEFKIDRFYNLVTSNVCEIERLELIYKIIAPLTHPKLTDYEMMKCLDLYIYALSVGIVELYSSVALGLYMKIEKNKISQYRNSIYHQIIKKKLLEIYGLLIEKMNEDQPSIILCEYAFYTSGILLMNDFKLDINFPEFQNYIRNSEPLIQVAAIWFFYSLTLIPGFLQDQELDVILFLKDLHEIYQDATYLVKEQLDTCIFSYLQLDFYDKYQIFDLLRDGFTETLVQIIQTKKNEVFEMLSFVNEIFEAAIEEQCIEQFSNQFMELGGFDAIQEFIDEPLPNQNEQTPYLASSIISRFKPSDSF